MTPITIRYPIRPRARSLAASAIADMFGFDADDAHITVAENVELDLRPSNLALFVGPSGSGKSSLLGAAAKQLDAVDVNALALPDTTLIDALSGPVPERLSLLSSCGLAEGRVMLRTPNELSDGQRARFRLAYALATCNRQPLMIDEFAAVLDRPLACVLAYNLRRIVSRTGVGALVATTHDDVIDDLNPDVLVRCRGEGLIDVTRRAPEKKAPVCCRSFGCHSAPEPTGRTSLGGITAKAGSASSPVSSSCGTSASQSASASLPRRPQASAIERDSSAPAATCTGQRWPR